MAETTARQIAEPNRGGSLATVLRGGARGAWLETRTQFRTLYGWSWFFLPLIGLGVMFALRNTEIADSAFSVAQYGLPGLLAMYLVTGGMLGVASQIISDSEDGTLLRAKAVPHGMASHLVGMVLLYTCLTLLPIAALLAGAAVLIPAAVQLDASGVVTLLVVSVLGLTSTLPLGALLGAWLKGPMALMWASLLIYGSLGITGIFYPMAGLPGWLQAIGQLLPTYWAGLGLRSALLPDAAAALEIGGSWRPVLTLVVLGVWTVIGLVLAPAALRRVSRRQTTSLVAAARDRVMSKGY